MSENELSRDEENAAPPRRLDRKTVIVFVAFCLVLGLLIALNMN